MCIMHNSPVRRLSGVMNHFYDDRLRDRRNAARKKVFLSPVCPRHDESRSPESDAKPFSGEKKFGKFIARCVEPCWLRIIAKL
jgi:hypothetical protein